jgi:hypothetical protein
MQCRLESTLWRWALIASILVIARPASADEVGPLGDLRAASIEGCKLIAADHVRDALLMDLTVMALASPSADLTDLLNAIQQQLITAYENNGFPRAKVNVGPDPSGKMLRIRIDEGRRYVAGALRLAGGKRVDEAALRRKLTDPPQGHDVPVKVDAAAESLIVETWTGFNSSFQESKREPLWQPGSPARFDEDFIPKVEREAHEALLLQGLCWAKLKASMEPREDGTAELLLTMVTEGPPASLDQIEIRGLQRFDPKQVQQFLGLAPGMPIDLNVLREVRRKLWESARFLKHEIKLDVAAAHPGKANLTIELMEHPKAPPLQEPLEKIAPDGALMLKLALSLQRRMDAGQPVLLEAQAGRLGARIIFQSNKGLLARLSRAPAVQPATKPTTRPGPAPEDMLLESPDAADLAFTAVDGKVGLFCPSARRRYVAAIESTTGILMAIQCVPDPLPNGQRASWGIGAGIKTNARTSLTGVFAPVFFFDLVSGHDGATTDPATKPATVPGGLEVRNGVATLRRESMAIRFDAATGNLLEVTGSQSHGQLHLRLAPLSPDAFQRELEQLAAASGEANEYDANRPVSSLIEFLAACQRQSHIIGSGAPVQGSGDFLLRLLATQALFPLDRLVIDQRTGNDADDPDFHTIPDGAALMANPMAVARWALWLPDLLYPYASWPWTIGHEAIMLVGGGSPTAGDELKRILSSGEIGPIGCLALSAALAQTNREYGRLVAKLGLERLDADQFARDFRVLLQSDRAGAKVLENLLDGLAKLSDQDADALERMLPGDGARQAIEFVREAARKEPGKPIAQVLAARQTEWWAAGLKSVVEGELRKLAEAETKN